MLILRVHRPGPFVLVLVLLAVFVRREVPRQVPSQRRRVPSDLPALLPVPDRDVPRILDRLRARAVLQQRGAGAARTCAPLPRRRPSSACKLQSSPHPSIRRGALTLRHRAAAARYADAQVSTVSCTVRRYSQIHPCRSPALRTQPRITAQSIAQSIAHRCTPPAACPEASPRRTASIRTPCRSCARSYRRQTVRSRFNLLHVHHVLVFQRLQ